MERTAEIGGMTYTPNFLKISTGIEAILRFCLSGLKDYDVYITD
jgi:hypothetical protein